MDDFSRHVSKLTELCILNLVLQYTCYWYLRSCAITHWAPFVNELISKGMLTGEPTASPPTATPTPPEYTL